MHELIDWQVDDLISQAQARLQEERSLRSATCAARRLVVEPRAPRWPRKNTNWKNFWRFASTGNPDLLAMRRKAQDMLAQMYAGYLTRPELLPASFRARAATVGLPRTVGDYIAGMTDRYAGRNLRGCLPARPAAKPPIGTFYYCFRSGVTDAGGVCFGLSPWSTPTARVTGVESVPAALCFGCGGASGRTAAPRRGVSTRINRRF